MYLHAMVVSQRLASSLDMATTSARAHALFEKEKKSFTTIYTFFPFSFTVFLLTFPLLGRERDVFIIQSARAEMLIVLPDLHYC
jgi:hypothetical protein